MLGRDPAALRMSAPTKVLILTLTVDTRPADTRRGSEFAVL